MSMADNTNPLNCWFQQYKIYADALKTGLDRPAVRSRGRLRKSSQYDSQYRALDTWYQTTYKNLSVRSFGRTTCNLQPAPTTVTGWRQAMTVLRNQFSAALVARGVPPGQTQAVVNTLDRFLIDLINNLQ